MADKFINATALLEGMPEVPYKGSVRRILMQAPAADVQPVRHGLWAELRVGDIGQAEQIVLFGCSECGVTSWYATPFCGHCGARMGGSNER